MEAEEPMPGALVGGSLSAHELYEKLRRGEVPAFATTPNGVPPTGGISHSSPSETSPNLIAQSGVNGPKVLSNLKEEVVGLRKEIRELMEMLRLL